MTGEELYNVTREEAARIAPLERGIVPLAPWDELPQQLQDKWDDKATEQAEREDA